MTQERQSHKKVNFKIRSKTHNCPDCGIPLKENSVIKGHTHCFYCFKIRNGKKFSMRNDKKIDYLAIQKQNRIKYGYIT